MSASGSGSGAAAAVAAAAAAAARVKPSKYVCGSCGHCQELSQRDQVRCRVCGYRVFYKTRTERCEYAPRRTRRDRDPRVSAAAATRPRA